MLDKADQGDFTANLRQSADKAGVVKLDLNSDSTTDRYKYTVTFVSGGKTYTTNLSTAEYENGQDITVVSSNNELTPKDGTASKVDDGSTLYVTVTNQGTNEVVQSNSIKFHTIG